jgi:hypothetical protein
LWSIHWCIAASQAFKGLWRMQQPNGRSDSTQLTYTLYVQPQKWLPVALIQNRIENEVKNNLSAVKKHAEKIVRIRRT